MWSLYAEGFLAREIGLDTLELERQKEEKEKKRKIAPASSIKYNQEVETSLKYKENFHVFVLSSLVARLSPFYIWEACSKGKEIDPLALVHRKAHPLPISQQDALLRFLTKRYSSLLGEFAANIEQLNLALEAKYKE